MCNGLHNYQAQSALTSTTAEAVCCSCTACGLLGTALRRLSKRPHLLVLLLLLLLIRLAPTQTGSQLLTVLLLRC
jgi:hypothetical protein